MADLFGASITPGAYRVAPLSIGEIDAHPDADRIWATVAQIRADAEAEIERRIDDATEEHADELEDAETQAWQECRTECQDIVAAAIGNLLEAWGDDISEKLAAAISKISEGLQ